LLTIVVGVYKFYLIQKWFETPEIRGTPIACTEKRMRELA
jgi:hypothetical protein